MRNEEQQNVVKIKRFKSINGINGLAMATNHVERAMKIKNCTDEKLACVFFFWKELASVLGVDN